MKVSWRQEGRWRGVGGSEQGAREKARVSCEGPWSEDHCTQAPFLSGSQAPYHNEEPSFVYT